MSRIISIILLFIVLPAASQYTDGGLWNSVSVEKGVIKKIDLGVELGVRLDQDMTQLESVFTDISLKYKVSDVIRTAFTYRLGSKFDALGIPEARHRGAFDVVLRTGWRDLDIGYRLRYQANTSGAVSGESGVEFKNALRNKLSLSHKIIKRTRLEASGEIFVGNNERYGNEISDYRLKLGVERRIKKRQYFSFGGLYQSEVNANNPGTDVVLYWAYSIELKGNLIKKKKSRAKPDSGPSVAPPSE